MFTPMAANYANFFMNMFETLLNDLHQKAGKKLVTFYRWHVFIWTDGEYLLKESLIFCQINSVIKKMKSVIKFEISKSCHPEHIKNLPKSQFLRLYKICSDTSDYIKKINEYLNFIKQA